MSGRGTKMYSPSEASCEAKAAYGDGLIASLSIQLTADLGKGFTQANLRYMRLFYLAFRNCHTLCDELSWSHYRLLISVENEEARAYYLEEARKSLWSVRELQRQINSLYYERLLENRTKKRGGKKAAIVQLKPIDKMSPQSVIRDPLVLEFLGLDESESADLVRYTLPLHNKRIFAAKYKLHLPSEQELIAELRRERTAIESAQLVTKLDAGEICRIKQSAFASAVR